MFSIPGYFKLNKSICMKSRLKSLLELKIKFSPKVTPSEEDSNTSYLLTENSQVTENKQ